MAIGTLIGNCRKHSTNRLFRLESRTARQLRIALALMCSTIVVRLPAIAIFFHNAVFVHFVYVPKRIFLMSYYRQLQTFMHFPVHRKMGSVNKRALVEVYHFLSFIWLASVVWLLKFPLECIITLLLYRNGLYARCSTTQKTASAKNQYKCANCYKLPEQHGSV